MNLRRNIYRLLGHVKLNLDAKRSTLSVINLLIIIPSITRDNNNKKMKKEEKENVDLICIYRLISKCVSKKAVMDEIDQLVGNQ